MRLSVELRGARIIVLVLLALAGAKLPGLAPNSSSAAARQWQVGTATDAPPVTTTVVPPSCAITGDKVVFPKRIMLGEQATITLSVRPACEGISQLSADVMIVMDRSGSMTYEGKLEAAKAAAIRFIDMMDPSLMRIGLLTFTGEIELRVRLTDDYEVLRTAIKRLSPIGDTDMAGGLRVSGGELLASGPGRRKVLILLTDGVQDGIPGDPVMVAQGLKDAGIEIFALGLGKDVDTASLQKIASDQSHYYPAPSATDLDAIYQRIGSRVLPVLPSNLLLDDIMGADIQFIPGSAAPPAAEQPNSLHWSVADLPDEGLTLTYAILPGRPGLLPTNLKAVVSYDAPHGVRHTFELPIPVIDVLTPAPTPTVTTEPSSAATVTVPTTPSGTASPTPTATQSPTVEIGEPLPLFLPVLVVETCPPRDHFIDVVVVLDASTSMLQPVASGQNKLDVARESVRTFLQGLRLRQGGDRAAIVTFNASAETLQGLTFDRLLLESALTRVVVRPQSRLERGIAMANARLLAGPRDRSQAIVLLTDGKVNPSLPETAIAAANTSRAAGVDVFVVGFGPDLEEVNLRAIAHVPDRYLPVPDPVKLVEAFRQLSRSVPCSSSAYWGRR